jgi:hypothetical protein
VSGLLCPPLVTLTAEFILVAAMNPYPCGYRSAIANRMTASDSRHSESADARLVHEIRGKPWGFKENGGSTIFDGGNYRQALTFCQQYDRQSRLKLENRQKV